jgi:hypothetical protein
MRAFIICTLHQKVLLQIYMREFGNIYDTGTGKPEVNRPLEITRSNGKGKVPVLN